MNVLTKAFTFRVTPRLMDDVYYLCENAGIKPADFLRLAVHEAVAHYLDRPERKAELLRRIKALPVYDSMQMLERLSGEKDFQEVFLSERMTGKRRAFYERQEDGSRDHEPGGER